MIDVCTHNLAELPSSALADAVVDALGVLAKDDVVARVAARDHTVWSEDPTEIANRLGWLDAPAAYLAQERELTALLTSARADGISKVLVLGMGGSSLFPEVLSRVFPDADGLELGIVDSTDPAAVLRATEAFPPADTIYIPASKSGGTIETRSQLAWFWGQAVEALGEDAAGSRFIAITDPDSSLAQLGRERRFRAVLLNNPDIGGRFSALSLFGVVPAALAGIDVAALLQSGVDGVARTTEPGAAANPALHFGAILGVLAGAGRDKLTLVTGEDLAPVGVWVEQLVAESTGKGGVGILPVVDEPIGPPEVYGDDRVFVVVGDVPAEVAALGEAGQPIVQLTASEGSVGPDDLGELLVLFEYATAIAGRIMGLNPFDQPNVESAKKAAGLALDDGPTDVELVTLEEQLSQVRPGDFVLLSAFIDPGSDLAAALPDLAIKLRDRLHVAVTVGIGPRYLHSTGQLHKGYAQTCVVAQVVGEDPEDVSPPEPVQDREFSFGQLKRAQADGDLRALQDSGARAARIPVDELRAAAGL